MKRKNVVNMIRQGDILLRRKEIPKEAKELQSGRIVLAEGEVTGHMHALEPVVPNAAILFGNGDERYVRIDAPTPFRHPEHDFLAAGNTTEEVPVGEWEVIRQREILPSEIRFVTD